MGFDCLTLLRFILQYPFILRNDYRVRFSNKLPCQCHTSKICVITPFLHCTTHWVHVLKQLVDMVINNNIGMLNVCINSFQCMWIHVPMLWSKFYPLCLMVSDTTIDTTINFRFIVINIRSRCIYNMYSSQFFEIAQLFPIGCSSSILLTIILLW